MQELIKRTLPQDDALNQAIVNELRSQNWAGFLNYSQVQQLCHNFELTTLKLAMHLLPLAASYSHTAISHFNVGAIAIGEQGDFYFGANQEFANSAIQQTIQDRKSVV